MNGKRIRETQLFIIFVLILQENMKGKSKYERKKGWLKKGGGLEAIFD
jgi:hypothetical protein